MNLSGWDYTGRNIGPDLHRQYRLMVNCLTDSEYIDHSTWGNAIQEKLALSLGMSSSGAVRTVKKICDNFGFLLPNALSSRHEIDPSALLSKRGELVYQTATLESQIVDSPQYNNTTKENAMNQIKALYEESYCDALKYYHFPIDGKNFYPLRATLRSIEAFGSLDKWEWYLLNTIVRHNDDPDEEAKLRKIIQRYRKGDYEFSMQNVVEKPKGHQYTPQYFEFAGLLHVIQRPKWIISDSNRHNDVKQEVLSDMYLSSVIQRGEKDE